MRRAVWSVAAAAVGVPTGAAAVLLHQRWGWLALAVLAGVMVVAWLPTRPPRVAWALASGFVVMRGAISRPEGDFLVPGNAQGWTLIASAAVGLLIALVLPDRADDPASRGSAT